MQKSYISSDAVTVHWKGFSDDESHIKDLECALVSENGESVMVFHPAFGSSFNIIMNQNQSLTDGHSYRAILKVHAFCFSERTISLLIHRLHVKGLFLMVPEKIR